MSMRTRGAVILLAALTVPAQHARADDLLVCGWLSSDIARYDAQGVGSSFIPAGLGGLASPHSLTLSPRNTLLVTSVATNSVLEYDLRDGSFIRVFIEPGNGLAAPTSLVFGPDGNAYVTSFNSDRVNRYDGQTGAFIDAFVPFREGGLDAPEMARFDTDGSLVDVFATTQDTDTDAPIDILFVPTPCRADIDASGSLDADDFFTFLDEFAAGCP